MDLIPSLDYSEMSLMEQVALLPPDERTEMLADLSEHDLADPKIWLRPKQLAVLYDPSPIVIYGSGRGSGKRTSVRTPVPTPTGWTTMGDLRAGDEIYDEAGNPCRVLVAHEPVLSERSHRLTFSDGATIDADAEHQWVTWTHRDRKQYLRSESSVTDFPEDWPTFRGPVWRIVGGGHKKEQIGEYGPQIRTTDDIIATVRHGTRSDLNHCIPLAGALWAPEADLLVDPWALGYWLGNGSRADGTITSGSKDGDFDGDHVAGCLAAAGLDTSRRDFEERGQSRFGVRGLKAKLNALRVLGDKHVPAQYLRASEMQRLALLRGLMDSDGYADDRKNTVEFCSSDRALADGVLELARSLSDRPVLAEGRAMLNGRDMGPKYRVRWRPSKHNPFALTRKASRIDMVRGAQALRHRHRMITSIEPIEPCWMRCLTVDSPNSMYLVGEAMIPTHNTRVGAHWTIEKAKTPGIRIHLIGRTVADVRDVMVQGPAGIIEVSPPDFVPEYHPSVRRLLWPNGSVGTTFCVTPEHEALTRHGWVRHESLLIGDEILTLNMDTGLAEWQPCTAVSTFPVVDEPMVVMKSRNHSSVTTMNHRWPVLNRTSRETAQRKWRTSKSLGTNDKIITIAEGRPRGGAVVASRNPMVTRLTGTVWCPTTPNGTWLCRHDGTVFFTGNSAEVPDMLRGPQCDHSWADELGTFNPNVDASGATTWDNITISTRLGVKPQILVTTTPRRTRIVKKLFSDAKEHPERVSLHGGSTMDNRAHLAPEYLLNLVAMYEGTTLADQELYGRLIDEVPGALWREADFVYEPLHEDLTKNLVTLIGVDPGLTTGGDTTGIVTVRGTMQRQISDRQLWVVRDDTEPGSSGISPERWAARIVAVWKEETLRTGKPALVIAEKNAGGELVSTVIHQCEGGEKVPVALVSAKGSKAQRAEPILLAYRRGRVKHAEPLEELELEMMSWEPEVSGWSPGRLDACVHAARALIVDESVMQGFGSITAVPPMASVPKDPYRNDRFSGSMSSIHRDPHNPRERAR